MVEKFPWRLERPGVEQAGQMGIGPEIPALGKWSNRSTRNVVFSDRQVIPIRIGADIQWRHHLQIDRDQ